MSKLRFAASIASALGIAGGAGLAFSSNPLAGEWKERIGTAAYKNVAWPILRNVDPEKSHELTIWASKYRLTPVDRVPDDPILHTEVFGLKFSNPLGLAAGCDKQAEAVESFLAMGFGAVEVGSITPLPQPGNEKPRLFRLEQDQGVINRYGFNSDGSDAVSARLKALRSGGALAGPVGVNLGKNKTGDAERDFTHGVRALGPLADYLVVNVSSPNTPGLRALQGKKELELLLRAVMLARRDACPKVPLLLKIAPDLTDAELADICQLALAVGVSGMIVTNTTNARPASLKCADVAGETGGLSGLPLKAMSTETIRKVYRLTKGKLPLIGVGGVGSGEDMYEKVRAGATLVQLYSRLAYEGPFAVPKMKRDLAALLKRDGFARLQDAVGADVKL